MGFSRQEYWSGLPCPPPRDLPFPGIEPAPLMPPPLAGGFLNAYLLLVLIHLELIHYFGELTLFSLSSAP